MFFKNSLKSHFIDTLTDGHVCLFSNYIPTDLFIYETPYCLDKTFSLYASKPARKHSSGFGGGEWRPEKVGHFLCPSIGANRERKSGSLDSLDRTGRFCPLS